MPKKIGLISKFFKGRDKLVVVIQDLHCNAEVQKNISASIQWLAQEHKLRLVGEEGAFETVNVSKLRTFPANRAREAVSCYFVQQGKLSGAEYYAVNAGNPIRLEGIETPALYAASEKLLASFVNSESQGYCCDLRDVLANLQAKIYGPSLRRFDALRTLYSRGKLDALKYGTELLQAGRSAGLDLRRFPVLQAFTFGKTPAWPEDLNLSALQEEMDALENSIREGLYAQAGERELDQVIRRVDVIERLLNISATPKDLEEFRQAPDRFRTEALLAFLQKCGEADSRAIDLSGLDQALAAAGKFYQLADQRSGHFVTNLLRKMDRFGESLSVMIVGGYHADGVLAELRRQNISYASIRPSLSRPDLVNPYFSLLSKKRTPLEKLLTKDQNILALRTLCADGPFTPEQTVKSNDLLSAEARMFSRTAEILAECAYLTELKAGGQTLARAAQQLLRTLSAYPADEAIGVDCPALAGGNEHEPGAAQAQIMVIPTTLASPQGRVRVVAVLGSQPVKATVPVAAFQRIDLDGRSFLFCYPKDLNGLKADILQQRPVRLLLPGNRQLILTFGLWGRMALTAWEFWQHPDYFQLPEIRQAWARLSRWSFQNLTAPPATKPGTYTHAPAEVADLSLKPEFEFQIYHLIRYLAAGDKAIQNQLTEEYAGWREHPAIRAIATGAYGEAGRQITDLPCSSELRRVLQAAAAATQALRLVQQDEYQEAGELLITADPHVRAAAESILQDWLPYEAWCRFKDLGKDALINPIVVAGRDMIEKAVIEQGLIHKVLPQGGVALDPAAGVHHNISYLTAGGARLVYKLTVRSGAVEIPLVVKVYTLAEGDRRFFIQWGIQKEIRLLKQLQAGALRQGLPNPIPEYYGHFRLASTEADLTGDILVEQYVGSQNLLSLLLSGDRPAEKKIRAVQAAVRSLLVMQRLSGKIIGDAVKLDNYQVGANFRAWIVDVGEAGNEIIPFLPLVGKKVSRQQLEKMLLTEFFPRAAQFAKNVEPEVLRRAIAAQIAETQTAGGSRQWFKTWFQAKPESAAFEINSKREAKLREIREYDPASGFARQARRARLYRFMAAEAGFVLGLGVFYPGFFLVFLAGSLLFVGLMLFIALRFIDPDTAVIARNNPWAVKSWGWMILATGLDSVADFSFKTWPKDFSRMVICLPLGGVWVALEKIMDGFMDQREQMNVLDRKRLLASLALRTHAGYSPLKHMAAYFDRLVFAENRWGQCLVIFEMFATLFWEDLKDINTDDPAENPYLASEIDMYGLADYYHLNEFAEILEKAKNTFPELFHTACEEIKLGVNPMLIYLQAKRKLYADPGAFGKMRAGWPEKDRRLYKLVYADYGVKPYVTYELLRAIDLRRPFGPEDLFGSDSEATVQALLAAGIIREAAGGKLYFLDEGFLEAFQAIDAKPDLTATPFTFTQAARITNLHPQPWVNRLFRAVDAWLGARPFDTLRRQLRAGRRPGPVGVFQALKNDLDTDEIEWQAHLAGQGISVAEESGQANARYGFWLEPEDVGAIFRAAGVRAGDTMLEIGPGHSLLCLIAALQGAKVTVVEPSQKYNTRLQAAYAQVKDLIELAGGEFSVLAEGILDGSTQDKLRGTQFDHVWALDVLSCPKYAARARESGFQKQTEDGLVDPAEIKAVADFIAGAKQPETGSVYVSFRKINRLNADENAVIRALQQRGRRATSVTEVATPYGSAGLLGLPYERGLVYRFGSGAASGAESAQAGKGRGILAAGQQKLGGRFALDRNPVLRLRIGLLRLAAQALPSLFVVNVHDQAGRPKRLRNSALLSVGLAAAGLGWFANHRLGSFEPEREEQGNQPDKPEALPSQARQSFLDTPNAYILKRSLWLEAVPGVRRVLLAGMAVFLTATREGGERLDQQAWPSERINDLPIIHDLKRAHIPESSGLVGGFQPSQVELRILTPAVGFWNYWLGQLWGHATIRSAEADDPRLGRLIIYIPESVLAPVLAAAESPEAGLPEMERQLLALMLQQQSSLYFGQIRQSARMRAWVWRLEDILFPALQFEAGSLPGWADYLPAGIRADLHARLQYQTPDAYLAYLSSRVQPRDTDLARELFSPGTSLNQAYLTLARMDPRRPAEYARGVNEFTRAWLHRLENLNGDAGRHLANLEGFSQIIGHMHSVPSLDLARITGGRNPFGSKNISVLIAPKCLLERGRAGMLRRMLKLVEGTPYARPRKTWPAFMRRGTVLCFRGSA